MFYAGRTIFRLRRNSPAEQSLFQPVCSPRAEWKHVASFKPMLWRRCNQQTRHDMPFLSLDFWTRSLPSTLTICNHGFEKKTIYILLNNIHVYIYIIFVDKFNIQHRTHYATKNLIEKHSHPCTTLFLTHMPNVDNIQSIRPMEIWRFEPGVFPPSPPLNSKSLKGQAQIKVTWEFSKTILGSFEITQLDCDGHT